ncbi:N-acetyltransferase [Cellulomonas sp. Leaf334]|uniref:GNAT family N-acetyltransferase n=1 Tax=Cellulomonas sp. Leaf334 TaxID=1736339 RepID=UPI0009E9800B|nr:GNAT family N-acetyltransferase [Cellulomonas sp. Leaf334]
MTITRIDGTTDARTTSAVVELFVAYRHFYGRLDTDDDARTFLHRRVRTQDSFVWAALADDGVAGFVQVYPAHTSLDLGTVWWLNDLFVAPTARAIGAGRALVQHVLDEAAANGVAEVRLETQPSNTTARALYERLGFTLDGPSAPVAEHDGGAFLTYTYGVPDPTTGAARMAPAESV